MVHIGYHKFKRTNETSPNFTERVIRYPTGSPHAVLPAIITYFHVSYNDPVRRATFEEHSLEHLLITLVSPKNKNHHFDDAQYLIAILWGIKETKMIDLFKYSGDWLGNPEVSSYVFEDGIYKPEKKEITCEDSLIVLGAEGIHRRKMAKILFGYLDNPPEIPGLTVIKEQYL